MGLFISLGAGSVVKGPPLNSTPVGIPSVLAYSSFCSSEIVYKKEADFISLRIDLLCRNRSIQNKGDSENCFREYTSSQAYNTNFFPEYCCTYRIKEFKYFLSCS